MVACYNPPRKRGMSPSQCWPNVGQLGIGGMKNAFFPMFGG
jgi:hypothetical protein